MFTFDHGLAPSMPAETLLPFQALPLRCAVLCAVASGAPPVNWIRDFSFLVPSDLEQPEVFDGGQQTFYAERYGGNGISVNGGGARCGLRGAYQVKGIGRTPVAGSNADFWHSHGGFSLTHALCELVWSEVLRVALPYGVARNMAVIATGTQCWEREGKGRKRVARALLVRENAVRPAHFLRAVFFRGAGGGSADHARVQAMLRQLDARLPSSGRADESCGDRLLEMARRWGAQSGAAVAKRILHGSITASNICLDGRWIDFGTVAAMPSFANTRSFGLPAQTRTLWDDWMDYDIIFDEMVFHIRKFLPGLAHDIGAPDLMARFNMAREQALHQHFLALTGLPQASLKTISLAAARQLTVALMALARTGVAKRQLPNAPDLRASGTTPLETLLPSLALCPLSSPLEQVLAQHAPVLPNGLLSAYQAVRLAGVQWAKQAGLSASRFHLLTALNARRLNRCVPALYRNNVVDDCARLVNASADALPQRVQHYLQAIRNVARAAYDVDTGLKSQVEGGGEGVHYDAASDQFLSQGGMQMSREWVLAREFPNRHFPVESWHRWLK